MWLKYSIIICYVHIHVFVFWLLNVICRLCLGDRLGVISIIDNVVTSDLIRMCVFGSALYHCHNWREEFVPLYFMHLQLSTVL